MILFACDWCRTIKQRDETWILGLAAESIGATAARREINILTGWDEGRACHPLAVQFCSVEHKDRYMAAMFETEPLPPETIIEEKTTVAPNRTSERRYMRTVSTGVVGTSKKKKKAVSSKRGRAA